MVAGTTPSTADREPATVPEAGARGGDTSGPEVGAVAPVVEDGVVRLAGQLGRSDFFAALEESVVLRVDEVLRPAGLTARECPYLARYLDHFRGEPLDRIARATALYASPVRQDAAGWIEAIAARAGLAAVRWRDGRVDPALGELTPSGEHDLAASLDARRDPAGAQDLLGPGRGLDPATRGRAEHAFGVDLSRVRVHTGEVAQRLASGAGAAAFTVGQDVGFAAGEYRPGTLRGDAILAHEIAHTRQQAGAARAVGAGSTTGERDADAQAVVAGRRDRGESLAPPTVPAQTGLRLQRCGGDDTEQAVPAAPSMLEGEDQDGAPEPDVAPASGTTSPAVDVDTQTAPEVEDLRDWTWQDGGADDVVLLVGEVQGGAGSHAVLLPGRGLVQQGAPPPARTGTAPPQRPPLIRMPASGHAGVHLVHTSGGLAALVDVGGQRTGGASTVQVTGISAVAARFGITRISDILVSHTHADHVSNLTELVRRGVVQAANVHLEAGQTGVAVGPLGAVLSDLRSATLSAAGFGPTWNPTGLTARTVAGPTAGAATIQSSLRLGSVVIDTVADAASARAFAQALQAQDWRRASRLADAATLMTRITGTGGGPATLVTGDMRGRDIMRVQRSMGAQAFADFVGSATTLSGLHHLGAVARNDVEGLQTLLRGMGIGRRGLTVVAQTGGRGEINMPLVRALQMAGVRVVALQAATGSAADQITIGSSGRVTGQGAIEWAADPATRTAHSRLRTMERATRAIESTPTYGGTGGARDQLLGGLRTEIERLRGLLEERMSLATGRLGRRGAAPAAETQRVTDNATALGQAGAVEQSLGPGELERLARSSASAGLLAEGIRRAERGGYARHEVRRLIFQVDPETARRIMSDELGRAQSRRGERRAWRNISRALRRQADLNRIATSSGGGSPRARGVALFGLALEAWNLASPFISQALAESREAEHRDFYLFWRDLSWWQEKGLRPVYQARAGGHDLAPAAVESGVGRRLHDDMGEADRAAITLTQEVREAAPVDQLYIPSLDQWPESEQRTFWTTLLLWVSTHLNNFDDYAGEIGDLPWAPIRQDPAAAGGFGDGRWQLRVGVLDSDGHVQERWQDSSDLTRIMNQAARRIIETTNAELRDRWTRRGEGHSDGAVLTAPGSPPVRFASDQPTTIRTFASGNAKVFGVVLEEAQELRRFRFWNDHPRFFVHPGIAAPSGYVWVSGADYNTAAAIRSQDTHTRLASVAIPKRPPPAYMEPFGPTDEEYLTPDQLFALRSATSSVPGFRYVASPSDRWNRGTVYFHELQPNDSGRLLVRISALADAATPSSDLPWGAEATAP